MKVIPYGQTARPVRIGFLGNARMVNAVKTRGHDEAGHEPLNRDRQFDVGVMKQNREQEDVLPEPECLGWDANCRNLHRAPGNRERELAGVETESGRRVEIAIDMMNQM